ncbi:MAG: hypothetical protein LCH53_10400 [Bacteroidetes bacterium]|nr:hypothetical protein [Bacteroidota bacterium]
MSRLRKIGTRYYLYFTDSRRTPREKSYPLGEVSPRKAKDMKADLDVQYRLQTFDPWCPSKDSSSAPGLLRDAIDRFFDERQGLSEATETNYRNTLTHFLHATPPGLRLSDVQPRHIATFVYDRACKPNTLGCVDITVGDASWRRKARN